jgi:hypothetical protein
MRASPWKYPLLSGLACAGVALEGADLDVLRDNTITLPRAHWLTMSRGRAGVTLLVLRSRIVARPAFVCQLSAAQSAVLAAGTAPVGVVISRKPLWRAHRLSDRGLTQRTGNPSL